MELALYRLALLEPRAWPEIFETYDPHQLLEHEIEPQGPSPQPNAPTPSQKKLKRDRHNKNEMAFGRDHPDLVPDRSASFKGLGQSQQKKLKNQQKGAGIRP